VQEENDAAATRAKRHAGNFLTARLN
jgi:hypothetical protein